MSNATILLIVLIVLLIGALPRWRHSMDWGHGPSGALALAALVLASLMMTNRI